MSVPPSATRSRRSAVGGLAVAAVVVGAVTAVLYPLSELDPGVSSGVLYVLGVLLLATYWGLWLGLVTSVASALALDFFHTHPTGHLLADEPEDLVAIAVLLLTASVASVIAGDANRRTLVISVMVAAVAAVHLPKGLWNTDGGYEYNLVMAASAFAVAGVGPGNWSLDDALGIDWSSGGWALGALAAGLLGGIGTVIGSRMAAAREERGTHAHPA